MFCTIHNSVAFAKLCSDRIASNSVAVKQEPWYIATTSLLWNSTSWTRNTITLIALTAATRFLSCKEIQMISEGTFNTHEQLKQLELDQVKETDLKISKMNYTAPKWLMNNWFVLMLPLRLAHYIGLNNRQWTLSITWISFDTSMDE